MGYGCTGRLPIMYMAYRPVLWTCYIVCLVLVLFGLFGNILSFMILGYDKSRRNQSSSFYLRALALADCMSLIFNTLLSSQQMMLRPAAMLDAMNPISLVVNTFPACSIRLLLSYACNMMSVYIIVMFSVERALVLLNPFRWSRFLTLRKAQAAVGVLFVISILLSLPALFSFNRVIIQYPKRLYNSSTGVTYPHFSRDLLDDTACLGNGTGLGGLGGNRSITDVKLHTGLLSEISTFQRRGNITGLRALNIRRLTRKPLPTVITTSTAVGPKSKPTLKKQLPATAPPPNYQDDLFLPPTLPPGVVVDCIRVPECRMNFAVFKPFAVFHIVSLSIVPFIVTGICNLTILAVLRRRDVQELRKATHPRRSKEESVDWQVTKRLILVSTTYIALSFPLALFHMVTEAMTGTYCYTWAANALTITLTLNSVNFAINFLLYCISEEQFRRLLTTLLHCRRKDLGRLLSYVTRTGAREAERARRTGAATGATGGGTGAAAVRGAGVRTTNSNTGAAGAAERSENGARRVETRETLETTGGDGAEGRTTDALVHSDELEQREDNCGEKHDFRDCNFVQDDWSSSQFSEGDIGKSGGGPVATAKWSEVLPESAFESPSLDSLEPVDLPEHPSTPNRQNPIF